MSADVLDLNPSLSSARRAFDHWRSNRARRGRTPVKLQRQAVALLEHHCAFHVCKALGINAVALKRWAGEPDLSDARPEDPVAVEGAAGFIRLPDSVDAPRVADDPAVGSLLIELPNETVVRVRGSFTLDQLFRAATRACADGEAR